MKTLDELFFMRLEPMIILYTVSSAYVDLYRVFVCRKKGMKNSEIAAEFGYKDANSCLTAQRKAFQIRF
ncbi:MAG: hypothetical protein ACLR56_12565 [Oscillospiraceae bacterium]